MDINKKMNVIFFTAESFQGAIPVFQNSTERSFKESPDFWIQHLTAIFGDENYM